MSARSSTSSKKEEDLTKLGYYIAFTDSEQGKDYNTWYNPNEKDGKKAYVRRVAN